MTPRQKIAAARLLATRQAPYFGAGLLALVPRETPGLGTLAVTAEAVLLWDAAAVDRWTPAELATVLVHELQHVLRGHLARCTVQDADPARWNVAADAEINDDLGGAPWALPDDPILPAKLGQPNGLTAEAYYHAIPTPQGSPARRLGTPADGGRSGGNPPGAGNTPAPGSAGQAQGKTSGASPARGGAAPSGEGSPADTPGGGGEAGRAGVKPPPTGSSSADAAAGRPRAGGGWCGSGAGRPVPGEPAPGDAAAPGRTPGAIERVRKAVARAVQEHASRGRGSVPAGLRRWADATLAPPKARWEALLARALRGACGSRAGAVDSCYTRRSRRQAGVGYGPGRPILPALRAPIPEVAVVLDTSGSMGRTELALGAREAHGVLRACGASITFLAADARVHALAPVRSWRALPDLVRGGGGTDFRPAFVALARLRRRPDVVVYLTDGDGPAPPAPPARMRVIWALVGKGRTPPAAWGTAIHIEP